MGPDVSQASAMPRQSPSNPDFFNLRMRTVAHGNAPQWAAAQWLLSAVTQILMSAEIMAKIVFEHLITKPPGRHSEVFRAFPTGR